MGKTARSIGVMLAILSVPYAVPALRSYRVVEPSWFGKRAHPPGEAEARKDEAPAPTIGEMLVPASDNAALANGNALPETAKSAEVVDPAVLAKTAGSLAIEDPTGHALDAFYASLAKTLKKDPSGVTRVVHYGDSLLVMDFISGTLRRRLQEKFGDAGHGFMFVARPWDWYFQNDVNHTASEGWSINRIVGPLVGDGMYGLGGVSFHANGPASASYSTVSTGDFGRKVSRFDVYYLEQPRGGELSLSTAGQPPVKISTAGASKVSKVHSYAVPDGAASFTLRAMGNGDVRVFGVILERETPGVSYDSLGMNGARIVHWDAMNASHWNDQLGLRKPAIVMLQYGTNESAVGIADVDAYEKAFTSVLVKVKAAAPQASVLVVSPLDRAEKAPDGTIRALPIMAKLVTAQRKVALGNGAAFWDSYTAMGGPGTMGRWLRSKPQLAKGDLTHPTPAGAQVIGDMLYKAMEAGYKGYASTHAEAPKL